jgi:hypothetical protein
MSAKPSKVQKTALKGAALLQVRSAVSALPSSPAH